MLTERLLGILKRPSGSSVHRQEQIIVKQFVKLETGRTGLSCDGAKWRNYMNTVTNIGVYKHQRITYQSDNYKSLLLL
jgi:hypothetical protein